MTQDDRDALAARYQVPLPRLALGRRLVGLASAALDVSDGLLADAGHIARRSAVALALEWPAVPLSPAARRALDASPDLLSRVVTGGDDYELLFTVAPQDWPAVEATAMSVGVPVAAIGRCTEGAGVVLLDGESRDITPPERGWRHGVSV